MGYALKLVDQMLLRLVGVSPDPILVILFWKGKLSNETALNSANVNSNDRR